MITDYHAKYFAHELTKRCAPDSVEKLAGAVASAQVDLNPHQVDAALFAFSSPLSKGALLADEVGLGKTIEAGLVISQRWAERRRRVLVITPSNLRKQWHQELSEKFFLPCTILESRSYNAAIKVGRFHPFDVKDTVVICSYQFARNKASDVHALPWDLVVIDEAHRLRNVYKPSNVIANTLKQALAKKPKLLLTATPLQNSLLELFGLVSFIDEHTFGDLRSFREQFANLSQERVFQVLKDRLKPICHRTLRRQVTAYVSFTRRLPMVEEFTPEEGEDRLYHVVSEYLRRENLQALPASQRSLITLVLRKLLASSTFAIAGALSSMSSRLQVFIDPPYNTGSAFEHYDDGVEHSIWLSLMRDRLEIIRRLISEDGSLWITIDDAEGHYLKVMCDEVFGRANFLGTVTWQKTTSVHNNAMFFSSATDMILTYAKEMSAFKMGRVPRSERNIGDYSNPDADERGPWTSSPLHVSLTSGQRGKQFARTGRSSGLFAIVSPLGEEIWPPKGRCWGYSPETIKHFEEKGLLWWGKDGRNQPRLKRFLRDNKEGIVPITLWPSDEVGNNQEAKTENSALLPDQAELFATPKPERLLKRVIELSTDTNDLVLDSFAGSGTTGAVAHKMGRRWIMVELGEHCHTHIIPRLKKMMDGEDKGGITEDVGWEGGGGFRYFRLAPSLIEKDKWDREVISREYNAAMLAEALCKLEGFNYAPSDAAYWQQGHSTERDFIYVTTQTLSHEQLQQLSEEVGPERSLLVLCAAFRGSTDRWSNLTVKKIPNHIRNKCEWGHDDYSLNVENLAEAPSKPGQQDLFADYGGSR